MKTETGPVDGSINDEGLKHARLLFDAYKQDVLNTYSKATQAGIPQPLVWIFNVNDDLGERLAQSWTQAYPRGAGADDRPQSNVVLRPASYRQSYEQCINSNMSHIKVPTPNPRQLDVMIVTHGHIWDFGLARPIESQAAPKPHDAWAVLARLLGTASQEVLMQAIVEPLEETDEGLLIKSLAIPWFAILHEIDQDPYFLYRFAQHPRKFEEFIAATYERAGWTHVVLTPQRGDRGRDVIATLPGIGAIRFLDQCKAFSPGRLVTHNDVRAMLGVLQLNPNASKAIVTTTSDFAPGILTSGEFDQVMPYRLELRNGEKLRQWLREVASGNDT